MPPNIILITTDQQRYDTLGCNGNALVQTPALDDLAAAGSRFDRAYVNNPVCIPSRACIQTGRYAHQHGVRYMESEIEKTPGLPSWEQTFMERLQVAGYDTGAVGKIHMKPPKGFDFTRLTDGKGARWKHPWGSPLGPAQLGEEYARWLEKRHPGGYEALYEQRRQPEYDQFNSAIVNVLPTEEYVDYWVTENALKFVQRQRSNPFFLWFGLCSPHPPIDPPREYAELYPEDQLPLSNRYTKRPDPSSGPSEQVVRRFVSYYYALCTFIDDMVRRLIDMLRRTGQWEQTLIIFTSDHGEMMGDFGRFGKGNFDDAVTHVPMIVKPPDGARAEARINGLVELIDIAPTILDYAGVRADPRIQGASMRPMIEGRGVGKEEVFCEYLNNDQSEHGKSIRTDRYKYNYWGPNKRIELYDLQEDPCEWHNFADDPAYTAVRIEMHERLLTRLMSSE